ncbi:rhodanese-like domain-containing protein [Algoriphagus sp. PAP.12]|uniref:rhodanese-like domain-containing protein n=1 Tax=Algoriphagus sp. PAP.12 TaxID=2996678 RepID=UPI00227D09B2|nr:rhodanese-like domain-containing protein [Algoriphagus sp. PAP.12]
MKNLKHLFWTLLLIAGVSFSVSAQTATDSAKVVSADKFEKLISKNKNTLLDLRTPQEVQEGHLVGATNLDFLDEDFLGKIEQLDKSKTYLLYCRTGNKTRKAGAAMKKAGFKKVIMLDGGITSWKAQGKPIEE